MEIGSEPELGRDDFDFISNNSHYSGVQDIEMLSRQATLRHYGFKVPLGFIQSQAETLLYKGIISMHDYMNVCKWAGLPTRKFGRDKGDSL